MSDVRGGHLCNRDHAIASDARPGDLYFHLETDGRLCALKPTGWVYDFAREEETGRWANVAVYREGSPSAYPLEPLDFLPEPPTALRLARLTRWTFLDLEQVESVVVVDSDRGYGKTIKIRTRSGGDVSIRIPASGDELVGKIDQRAQDWLRDNLGELLEVEPEEGTS